jgi:hypothetical protein
VVAVAGSRAMGGRVGLLELAGARGHLLADHVHGRSAERGGEGAAVAGFAAAP